ncbi:MAG: FAD binding domain-containing protein [Anaerolineae bacterium]|nr:FAD binding domain-containing protein [Anaerolineae bacterium]
MQRVDYVFPGSVEEAVGMLEDGKAGARIVAGGTDVLPDLRKGRLGPCMLVDVTRIPGLDRIVVTDEHVEVGAAVTFAALKASPYLRQHVHALADAAASVGAQAIQNAATWVGNIVQAMPAADGAVVAVALGAEARVVDAAGAAWRAVETLFRGPGRSEIDPTRQFVTHVRFPRPAGAWGTAWGRIGRRPSLVLPILNCAVVVGLDAKRAVIDSAAIALGPVAPCPMRACAAEAFLVGQTPGPEVFAHAAELARDESNPRDSPMRASRAYRLEVIPPLVSDALGLAVARAIKSSHELTQINTN